MPEISPMLIGLIVCGAVIGVIAGWLFRGSRIAREKRAIHSSWKDQIAAQKKEHDRIVDQNKSLMEQISQYRTAKKDADARAREHADSLKEALDQTGELKKQLREMRSNLEVTTRQRDRLKQQANTASARDQSRDTAMREKDEKIFKLSRELESWQEKLPPLLEKYRERDLEAQQLEVELQKLSAQLEGSADERDVDDGTRVEAVEDTSLANRLDASNEQYDDEGEATAADGLASSDDTPDDERTAAEALPDEADEDIGAEDAAQEIESDDNLAPKAKLDPSKANGRLPQDETSDDELTAIEALLDEGTVDFDLGDSALETESDAALARCDAIDESIVEVFESDATIVDVDELLDDSGGREIRKHATDDAVEEIVEPTTSADDRESRTVASGLLPSPESPAAGNGRDHDDLQQIKGVGPAIEKTLNDLGIYRFDQIAGMNEVEIDRVAGELRGFRSRIYREDWIGQARLLSHEKAGHSS